MLALVVMHLAFSLGTMARAWECADYRAYRDAIRGYVVVYVASHAMIAAGGALAAIEGILAHRRPSSAPRNIILGSLITLAVITLLLCFCAEPTVNLRIVHQLLLLAPLLFLLVEGAVGLLTQVLQRHGEGQGFEVRAMGPKSTG